MPTLTWTPIPRQRVTAHGVGYLSYGSQPLHAPMAVYYGYAGIRAALALVAWLYIGFVAFRVAGAGL